MNDRPAAAECCISRSASIDGELRRIARTEIDFALDQTRAASNPAHAVHECRKAVKRLRALVRLGRGADAGAARGIDRKLRDAARLLAKARDAEVIDRTAANLRDGDAPAMSIRIAARPADAAPDPETLREVAHRLADAGADLDAYFVGRARTPESLGASIERACRKTARLMDRFRERDGQARAHDWRRSVQRYANQLTLMADFCPERAAAELGALGKLAKCLGEYNDLTILRAALENGRVGVDAQSRSALHKLARTRQRILRERALGLGEPVFRAPDRRATGARLKLEKDPHRWL